MKLYDKRRITIMIISFILGLIFAGYIIYDQTGKLGLTGIALGLTSLFVISIMIIMIKKGNKE